jgi:hypothetical protein
LLFVDLSLGGTPFAAIDDGTLGGDCLISADAMIDETD